jgi:hypothetical protein
MSCLDALDERDVAQRVPKIIAKKCTPVPMIRLSTEQLRDSAQGAHFNQI